MSEAVAYFDASAFVKLLTDERESAAVRSALDDWPQHASSALLRTEAVRAVRHRGPEAVERAREALARIRLIPIDDALLDTAALLEPAIMRSLDAIHLAAALQLGVDLAVVFTYDHRMREGAELLGLPVASPA